jgi:hypothetical protein
LLFLIVGRRQQVRRGGLRQQQRFRGTSETIHRRGRELILNFVSDLARAAAPQTAVAGVKSVKLFIFA